MSITKKDLQQIKQLINEDSANLRHELKVDMKLIKIEIKSEIMQEVRMLFNSLKIYMDVEYRKINSRIERIEGFTGELKNNALRLSRIAENHENRLEKVESELRIN